MQSNAPALSDSPHGHEFRINGILHFAQCVEENILNPLRSVANDPTKQVCEYGPDRSVYLGGYQFNTTLMQWILNYDASANMNAAIGLLYFIMKIKPILVHKALSVNSGISCEIRTLDSYEHESLSLSPQFYDCHDQHENTILIVPLEGDSVFELQHIGEEHQFENHVNPSESSDELKVYLQPITPGDVLVVTDSACIALISKVRRVAYKPGVVTRVAIFRHFTLDIHGDKLFGVDPRVYDRPLVPFVPPEPVIPVVVAQTINREIKSHKMDVEDATHDIGLFVVGNLDSTSACPFVRRIDSKLLEFNAVDRLIHKGDGVHNKSMPPQVIPRNTSVFGVSGWLMTTAEFNAFDVDTHNKYSKLGLRTNLHTFVNSEWSDVWDAARYKNTEWWIVLDPNSFAASAVVSMVTDKKDTRVNCKIQEYNAVKHKLKHSEEEGESTKYVVVGDYMLFQTLSSGVIRPGEQLVCCHQPTSLSSSSSSSDTNAIRLFKRKQTTSSSSSSSSSSVSTSDKRQQEQHIKEASDAVYAFVTNLMNSDSTKIPFVRKLSKSSKTFQTSLRVEKSVYITNKADGVFNTGVLNNSDKSIREKTTIGSVEGWLITNQELFQFEEETQYQYFYAIEAKKLADMVNAAWNNAWDDKYKDTMWYILMDPGCVVANINSAPHNEEDDDDEDDDEVYANCVAKSSTAAGIITTMPDGRLRVSGDFITIKTEPHAKPIPSGAELFYDYMEAIRQRSTNEYRKARQKEIYKLLHGSSLTSDSDDDDNDDDNDDKEVSTRVVATKRLKQKSKRRHKRVIRKPNKANKDYDADTEAEYTKKWESMQLLHDHIQAYVDELEQNQAYCPCPYVRQLITISGESTALPELVCRKSTEVTTAAGGKYMLGVFYDTEDVSDGSNDIKSSSGEPEPIVCTYTGWIMTTEEYLVLNERENSRALYGIDIKFLQQYADDLCQAKERRDRWSGKDWVLMGDPITLGGNINTTAGVRYTNISGDIKARTPNCKFVEDDTELSAIEKQVDSARKRNDVNARCSVSNALVGVRKLANRVIKPGDELFVLYDKLLREPDDSETERDEAIISREIAQQEQDAIQNAKRLR